MNFKYTFIAIIAMLYCSCAGSPPPGHPSASGLFSKKILLQSSEGLYVRLDNSKEPFLLADASTPAQADTFYFCDLGNNVAGFQTMDEKYISAHRGKDNQLCVHQTYIGDWEKFRFQYQDSFVVFQALTNDLYIIPTPSNNYILAATFTTSSNSLCRFKITNLP